VDSCHAAGTEILMGPYHQPLGIFSGDPVSMDEWKRAAEVHRKASDYAQEAGVKLVIEWLNRFECYFITTMQQGADYAALVDHPNFTTMYDTFHANIEEKHPAESLRKYIKSVGHVHISENDRGTPGTGHLPWAEVAVALRGVGYRGRVVIETFSDRVEAIARAAAIWRPLFPDSDAIARDGLAFLRPLLAPAS